MHKTGLLSWQLLDSVRELDGLQTFDSESLTAVSRNQIIITKSQSNSESTDTLIEKMTALRYRRQDLVTDHVESHIQTCKEC